ncbi:hypothetical protein H0R92_02485 [Treponema sp. OMZ 840]|uniref:Piwi domain-containing protein n=1 Tax=Treponema sp. OMZ 840 TaxID=244313 RepID=UPI003D9195B0
MEKDLQINILTLKNSDFRFHLYSKSYKQYEKNSSLYFTRINNEIFGVSYNEYTDFEKKEYVSFDNTELTKWYLFNLLQDNCRKHNIRFYAFEKFNYHVDIELCRDDELGQEVITVAPTYLNSKKKFGFILNYRFIKNKGVGFSKEVQIKSLSLDINGNENKNYYIDKYQKINNFIKKNFSSIFSFNDILVENTFETIVSNTLQTKQYQFRNSQIENSQFQGIKKFGPYIPIDIIQPSPKICFIYISNEKNYAHKLYFALEGKTFSTFSGMEKMFHFPLNENTVTGKSVENYSVESIKEIIKKIKEEHPLNFIVPILIVPWSKENASEEQKELYYKLKHLFLTNKMPSQFISINKITNDNILKWAISSLAIQIFSKLGGSPWVVTPKTSNCLIIGIGQTYQRDQNSNIQKFFSYSILTDTTGLFKGIKILANTNNKDDYADNLSKSLKDIVNNYTNEYNTFVIHTSFRMSNKDIKTIKKTLDEIKHQRDITLAILRFDDNHNYLCFDKSFNSLVPLESSEVSLSYSKYLIWFEGQQYGQYTIRHRIGAPIKISVDYPSDINSEKINNYLQDAINLSGANWRGFNAKSIPISLLYAELISHFISAFDKYNLEQINIENLTPWFL